MDFSPSKEDFDSLRRTHSDLRHANFIMQQRIATLNLIRQKLQQKAQVSEQPPKPSNDS